MKAFLKLWHAGATLVVVPRLLIVVASVDVEHGLKGTWASVVAALGLSTHAFWALEYRLSSCDAWA